ncbi:MAG: LysR family transcriptional regulator [Spirochaetes bacterium]|nr:LysR family transcriptional regulator [Spirochaetota bacterium]
MKDLKAVIRIHVWIESDKGMILGPGRAKLIENIEKYGSLQNAAKKMGISYRAAWGRIKKTEEVLGYNLLVKTPGGYHLSDLGRELYQKYKAWYQKIESHALRESQGVFPWKSVPYQADE